MRKQGRVLRDPRLGPGLLMVEGRQVPFAMEGVWLSETPPRPGLLVDAEIDRHGTVREIRVAPESSHQRLEAEAASLLSANRAARARMSSALATLVVAGTLVAGWWFLTAVSIRTPLPERLDLTFWDLLGYINAGGGLDLLDPQDSPNPGVYGGLALFALMAALVQFWWKDRRALFGGLLPLILMVLAAIAVRGPLQKAIELATAAPGHSAALAPDTHRGILSSVSLGLGGYLSLSAATWVCFISLKNFAHWRAGKRAPSASYRKAA